MNQTKIDNRLVLIAGSAPASEKTASRQPATQRASSQRIVVIRNGELVNSRPGR